MRTEIINLGERRVNTGVHVGLDKVCENGLVAGRNTRMNKPMSRPERHSPPSGFIDGVGADDESFRWQPHLVGVRSYGVTIGARAAYVASAFTAAIVASWLAFHTRWRATRH